MIRGIHYFSTELKTKIDVIPRSCFKHVPSTLPNLIFDSHKVVVRGIPRPTTLSG